jgi:archaellum component FlaC
MMVEILVALCTILVVTLLYVVWNLMKKTELLESWVESFTQDINKVKSELDNIDSTGHFEADDEVGAIFNEIKDIINTLNTIYGETE